METRVKPENGIDSVASLPHPFGAHFVRPNSLCEFVEPGFKSLEMASLGYESEAVRFVQMYGGERGIRTLEGVLALTPLAGERFRPLSHLSEICWSSANQDSNCAFAGSASAPSYWWTISR